MVNCDLKAELGKPEDESLDQRVCHSHQVLCGVRVWGGGLLTWARSAGLVGAASPSASGGVGAGVGPVWRRGGGGGVGPWMRCRLEASSGASAAGGPVGGSRPRPRAALEERGKGGGSEVAGGHDTQHTTPTRIISSSYPTPRLLLTPLPPKPPTHLLPCTSTPPPPSPLTCSPCNPPSGCT